MLAARASSAVRRSVCRSGSALLLGLSLLPAAAADVVSLEPSLDNTIYEDPPGENSNGAGLYLFCGTQASDGWARRALLQFDLSTVPPGSVVNSASLSLFVNQTISGAQSMGLHRVTTGWGEGTSDAPGQEGGGTAATAGDATWSSALHPSTPWTSAGGDFEAAPSALALVDAEGSTPTWSSAQLAADVQAWIDGSTSNFGWILVHQDEAPLGTAKRFASRESSFAPNRPLLTIDYSPPSSAPGVAYCSGDGSGTACPCGNAGANGTGCANGTGVGARLEGTGTTSVGADDLTLTVTGLPAGPGLFFQGEAAVSAGSGSPFGDGLRCAGGPVRRLEIQVADSGNAFTVTTAGSIRTGGSVSAGETRYYQYWYRDALGSPCGALFNLSNGYELTWTP